MESCVKKGLCFLVALFLSGIPEIGGAAADQLAQSRYVDPKGTFKIVPPLGWQVQEFPQDPRGKVAFNGPHANTDLRILVHAIDFSSIDELVERLKQIEQRIGTSTNIERTQFSGKPAIKRTFEMRGITFFVIDFLIGSVSHNLQFGAPAGPYATYLPIARSMETYEPIVRKSFQKDMVVEQTAKKVRMAQLMIEIGNYDLALDYIKEGLEWSPQNKELLQLKHEVEQKK